MRPLSIQLGDEPSGEGASSEIEGAGLQPGVFIGQIRTFILGEVSERGQSVRGKVEDYSNRTTSRSSKYVELN